MHAAINRRSFLGSSLAAGLGVVLGQNQGWGVEPFARVGPARFLLSLAAYSFREYFVDDRGRSRASEGKRNLTLTGFIDFCGQHGCHGAELTSYYFPADTDDAFLLQLRRHAFLRGVEISGTAVGNSFTSPQAERRQQEVELVKRWVDQAAVMGAPHIRVFAGNAGSLSLAEAQRLCIEALEECAAYAGNKGIFLGIENHGGIVAHPDGLLEIVRAVQSPWVGINLDTGNFHSEDPYRDLRLCAPYAVNVQVKVEMQRPGRPKEPTDLEQIVGILREVNYQGYVALEYEAAGDPFTAVPEWLGKLKAAL